MALSRGLKTQLELNQHTIERLVYLIYEQYGPYENVAFDDHHDIVRGDNPRTRCR